MSARAGSIGAAPRRQASTARSVARFRSTWHHQRSGGAAFHLRRRAMTRSRARRAVLPATAALVLAISQASGALAVSPTLTVGANHDISRFADNEAETTVAVNPTNPN